MTDYLDAALDLAATGVPVFPVGPDKAPRTPRGFHDATTDADAIRRWDWNGGGMVAAAIVPGQVVIDVDPRNGGTETLRALRDAGRSLPPTRTVRTRGGGFHYYLTVPADVTLRAILGPGIDVKRAGKGYVVVPPSPGYALLSAADVAPAPDWLLEELKVPEREARESEAAAPKFFPFETGTAYGQAALEREIGRLATAAEGGRNNALNRAAFALAQLVAGGELSEDAAHEALMAVADRIGLESAEAAATIKSGWRAGEGEPRQAPEKDTTAGEGNRETPSDPGYGTPAAEPQAEAERRFWVDWDVDEPPPPFYLDPVIPKHAYVLVYGATEASKSMVFNGLLAQASHLGIRSSVYSLENPPGTDRNRLRRLRPRADHFRLTNEPLDFNDPRQLEGLVEREKTWGTDIVLIDTYSHAFNSRSEDGNAKAIEFARRVRWVMHEVGCTVVVVDHTGYAQSDEPRDASAKRQAVDVAVLMQKSGEWRPGQPARFMMTNKKAARFANPFHYTGQIRDVEDTGGLEITFMGEGPTWRD